MYVPEGRSLEGHKPHRLITGEFYMDMSSMGASCEGYAPFEIEYLRPLEEKDYEKLKKKMEEKVQAVRDTIEENREMIDEYMEETDGGKAFGGMNEQE